MKLYSAFDAKVNEYYSPFEAPHDIGAEREIQKLMTQNPGMNRMVLHRDDFVLVRVGDFDIATGVFEQVAPSPVKTFSSLWTDLQQKVEKGQPNV